MVIERRNIMHGPYDDPYMFPALNGGEPDDYDEHWEKVRLSKIVHDKEKRRELYKKLKEEFET